MKNLSTVEMYNPDTNEWSFVASMEKHEGGVGVGVIPMEEYLHGRITPFCIFVTVSMFTY